MNAPFKTVFGPPPYLDFNGSGSPLVFAHANGYPPGSYSRFLSKLGGTFHVYAPKQRPIWGGDDPEKEMESWDTLADDLIVFIEKLRIAPVTGTGHSMGGTATLFAAAKRPDLFRKIVLIDPVFLGTPQAPIPRMPKKVMEQSPMIRKTLDRPDIWNTRQEAYDFHRPKKVFARIPDEVMWDYVNHGMKETPEGKIALKYPKLWEAHLYCTPPFVWQMLKDVKVPLAAIYAEHTDLITPPVRNEWEKLRPDHRLIEAKDVGHLLPLEKPSVVADLVLGALA